MGDDFQAIVDLEATLEEASCLAKVVADALEGEGIIGPRRAESPGMQARKLPGLEGHPKGFAAEKVVKDPGGFTGDTTLFHRVEVIAGRQVHGESEESPISIECPSCGASEKDMSGWADAIADWEYSGGPGDIECRSCGTSAPVHRWKHEPLWAFGNLGLVFWNWPELREDFIDHLAKLLGHRVAVVHGMF